MSLEVKIIERKRYGNISLEVHLNGLLLTTNSYLSVDALVESLNLKLISSETTDKGYTDCDLIMYFTQKEFSMKSYMIIDQTTRTKLVENALFCINTLGQDINTIVYVVNGIKIKATDLLDNT